MAKCGCHGKLLVADRHAHPAQGVQIFSPGICHLVCLHYRLVHGMGGFVAGNGIEARAAQRFEPPHPGNRHGINQSALSVFGELPSSTMTALRV